MERRQVSHPVRRDCSLSRRCGDWLIRTLDEQFASEAIGEAMFQLGVIEPLDSRLRTQMEEGAE